MTDQAEFARNFTGSPPPELVKLLDFQNARSGFERYAEGFGLMADDKAGLRSWSSDAGFLGRLMPFAQANGGGSFYALWSDGGSDESKFPVVVFGDEGGVHLVAEHVRALLQLLAYDVEPMVDLDKVTYYKDKDHKPRKDHDGYVTWLAELGLAPVDDPKPLVAAAQAKLKKTFDAWFAGYVK